MAEKRKPDIRFKGFTDDWEQRKLGDVCQITMGQSPDGATYSDVPSDYILVQGNADLKNGWVCPRIWTTQKTKTAEAGDLIMSVRAPAGAMGKTAYDVVLGRGVAGIKGNEFIYQTLVKMDEDGYWKKLAAGSTFESINSDVISNAVIAVPQDVGEQEKLGAYFRNLDNLITLHQRKYDKLINVKKFMLQKMFPQNGSNVPEIRFAGFMDAWEQRKLGELTEIKDSARIPNTEWVESGVPYIRASDVTNDNTEGTLFIAHERYEFYKNKTGAPSLGDVLFNGGGEIGKTLLKADEKPIYVQGGAVLYARTSLSEELVGQYLKIYFETASAKNYIESASAGGTMKHFTLKPSQEMPILFPTKDEQRKIGFFFEKLDYSLTLHQSKLEKLKKIKKSMLEKMFI